MAIPTGDTCSAWNLRMNRSTDSAFLALFGAALWGASAWLLANAPILVPMKRHAGYFVLSDMHLWLVATSPFLVGTTLLLAALRVHRGGELRPDTVTLAETACFLAAIALLLVGLLTAPRILS